MAFCVFLSLSIVFSSFIFFWYVSVCYSFLWLNYSTVWLYHILFSIHHLIGIWIAAFLSTVLKIPGVFEIVTGWLCRCVLEEIHAVSGNWVSCSCDHEFKESVSVISFMLINIFFYERKQWISLCSRTFVVKKLLSHYLGLPWWLRW